MAGFQGDLMAGFHDDLMAGFHDNLVWLVSDFMAHIGPFKTWADLQISILQIR